MLIPESSNEVVELKRNEAFLRLDSEYEFHEYRTEDGVAITREALESHLLGFNPHQSGQSEFPNSAIPAKELRADHFPIIDLAISLEENYQKRYLRNEILDFLRKYLF